MRSTFLTLLFTIGILSHTTILQAEPDHVGAGNAGGEARLYFRKAAQRIYEVIRLMPNDMQSELLGNVSLEEFKSIVENVALIEVSNLSADSRGNVEPIAKSYPPNQVDADLYPFGVIKINKNKFLNSDEKLTHVCHELLGIKNMDKNYENCSPFISYIIDSYDLMTLNIENESCKLTRFAKIKLIDVRPLISSFHSLSKKLRPNTRTLVLLNMNDTEYTMNKNNLPWEIYKSASNRPSIQSESYFISAADSKRENVNINFSVIDQENNKNIQVHKISGQLNLNNIDEDSVQEIKSKDFKFSFKVSYSDNCVTNKNLFIRYKNDAVTLIRDINSVTLPSNLMVGNSVNAVELDIFMKKLYKLKLRILDFYDFQQYEKIKLTYNTLIERIKSVALISGSKQLRSIDFDKLHILRLNANKQFFTEEANYYYDINSISLAI